VAFKINNRSKVNKSYLKFNGNFKSHITFGDDSRKTLRSLIILLYKNSSLSNHIMEKEVIEQWQPGGGLGSSHPLKKA
jgi:hypothetical protein